MKKIVLATIVITFAIAACKTKKETAKTETTKTETPVAKPAVDCGVSGLTYASIKSIIDNNCTSCHGYGGAGGYNFLSIDDVKRSGKNGELLGTIKHTRGFPRMPDNAQQLDQASIDQIECWINNGMKE